MMLRDFPFIPYSKKVLSNSEKHANTHSNELKREQNTTLALRGHGHNSLREGQPKILLNVLNRNPKGGVANDFVECWKLKPKERAATC